ncbi:hypothetical protein [Corynebacterium pygosceleis]|uniref:hypothetical protein n=1 Tax=Corynebacterium pygosceleis TaxID=2800406 RepID=UPI00200592D0|nr:hypothetical protein [Corynebacterium pygosceleis]MCK7676383.1 hypothetical protein [Corynebacterium pygosceleis]
MKTKITDLLRAKGERWTSTSELVDALDTLARDHYTTRDTFRPAYWTVPKMTAVFQTAALNDPRMRRDTRDSLTDDGLLDPDGHLTPKGWAAVEYLRRTQR